MNVKPEILAHLGLSKPTKPENDDGLWERAEQAYEWISMNFEFCKEKAEDYTQFNFTSPDDLIDPEEDEWCGDLDDFAMLYAGLMYASGVNEQDIIVACGGNHCWNLLLKRDKPYEGWYIIDSACAQAYYVSKQYDSTSVKKSFPGYWQSLKCFPDYTAEITFGPNFFKKE